MGIDSIVETILVGEGQRGLTVDKCNVVNRKVDNVYESNETRPSLRVNNIFEMTFHHRLLPVNSLCMEYISITLDSAA